MRLGTASGFVHHYTHRFWHNTSRKESDLARMQAVCSEQAWPCPALTEPALEDLKPYGSVRISPYQCQGLMSLGALEPPLPF